jgi:PTS system nitrogen regulatory IIA component
MCRNRAATHLNRGRGVPLPTRPGCYDGFLRNCFDRRRHQRDPALGNALMNRLAAILPASNVLVNVDATSKKRAFEQAGLLFENQHSIARGIVTDNLFARERLGSTGLGHAVAIPHGRIKGLKNPLAAVVRVLQPIPFDAPDDEPVALLIFLLVPEAATQRHLEILSEIAEMLSDRELRERLKTEPDAAVVHQLIHDWEPLKSAA